MKHNKAKKAIALSLAATTLLSMTACNNQIKGIKALEPENYMTQELAGKPYDDNFINSTANYSIELFKSEYAMKTSENVLVSPESAYEALSMTANGANGDTLLEMENVLGGNLSINDINDYMLTRKQSLTATGDTKFHLANSIWYNDDSERITPKDSFLQTCYDYYQAPAYKAPFDDNTKDAINEWTKKNTDGMIPVLLNKIPSNAVMYLINATAFEGEWDVPYEKDDIITDQQFTKEDGSTINVDMMKSEEHLYIETEYATGFVKPYKDGQFAFVALLPREEISLDQYVANMDGEEFINAYNNLYYKSVLTRIPEFSNDYDTDLANTLKTMGMIAPFEETADFSNMADTTTGELYIGSVIHKTHIEVNREGTKAAAATAVEMVDKAMAPMEEEEPIIVTLDRPFVYAIIDMETGLPIFIGTTSTIE